MSFPWDPADGGEPSPDSPSPLPGPSGAAPVTITTIEDIIAHPEVYIVPLELAIASFLALVFLISSCCWCCRIHPKGANYSATRKTCASFACIFFWLAWAGATGLGILYQATDVRPLPLLPFFWQATIGVSVGLLVFLLCTICCLRRSCCADRSYKARYSGAVSEYQMTAWGSPVAQERQYMHQNASVLVCNLCEGTNRLNINMTMAQVETSGQAARVMETVLATMTMGCPTCNPSEALKIAVPTVPPKEITVACTACQGRGLVTVQLRDNSFQHVQLRELDIPCPHCQALVQDYGACGGCGGGGRVLLQLKLLRNTSPNPVILGHEIITCPVCGGGRPPSYHSQV